MNKSEIEIKLKSINRDEKIYAILDMVNTIDDPLWIQDRLLELIYDNDFWVAKNAVTAISDLARIHNVLDKEKVLSEFEKIKNIELMPIIRNVISDIDIFLD